MNRFFAPGREFSLIEKMFAADRFSRDGKGLGDDAFLFEPQPGSKWVMTADASAEGIHYRLDWASPERALRKALLANLSDINAMGGHARHAFLNLGARPEWDETVFGDLGQTLREMENAHDFRVSGGDTIKTADKSFFAFTVMGEVAGRPLLRSACKPGHRVYVSGNLGGSAAGLLLLENGKPPRDLQQILIDAHLDPKPPLQLGPALAQLDREIAAIDISDGLSSELWHVSRQSGCSLCIDWDKLPAHPNLSSLKTGFRDLILNGGEEYQLLFTGDFSSAELNQLRTLTSITEIGEANLGDGVLMTEGGETSLLPAGGFSHGKA